MNRLLQLILIASTLVASWLGMQAVHESGHVLGALATGGNVERVVLYPLAISRTDVMPNPRPLVVVWAGPIFGVLLPLAVWGAASATQLRGAFVLRFFAGFCLIANGAYISLGSFSRIGDCGEMLRHGSAIWLLWLFGMLAIPFGFWLWHRQGIYFGIVSTGVVDRRVAYVTLVASLVLVLLGYFFGDG